MKGGNLDELTVYEFDSLGIFSFQEEDTVSTVFYVQGEFAE